MDKELTICYLGLQDYEKVWQAMCIKNSEKVWTGDELWLTEHPSVYTLGSQGGLEHLLSPTTIPVIASDRGGSITYHGPGQLVIYPLFNLRSHTISVRNLINTLEQALAIWVRQYISTIHLISEQRGLFINGNKLISLGLRIANARTYHGMSVNISMDLKPFDNIHPCGYPGLKMTQWLDHCAFPKLWYESLEDAFCNNFNYTHKKRDLQYDSNSNQITWPRQIS